MTPFEEWLTEQVESPDCPEHLRDIHHEMFGKARIPFWKWLKSNL